MIAPTDDAADLPPWFTAARESPGERAKTQVEGVAISYRSWGPAGRPGLVLLHGGAGNAAWWDHVAPMLAQEGRRVVALDLSGHGDSARRERYGLDVWAREALAVAAAAGVVGRPALVGHSMGGAVTLAATQQFGSSLGGAIVIDSVVGTLSVEERQARERRAVRPLHRYPSQAAALERFRPVPDQGRPLLEFVVDHVARESVRREGDGWVWKFDPATYQRTQLTPEGLGATDCPIALVRAEYGRMTPQSSARLHVRLGGRVIAVEIPESGHHIMFEQPVALVVALRTILSAWEER